MHKLRVSALTLGQVRGGVGAETKVPSGSSCAICEPRDAQTSAHGTREAGILTPNHPQAQCSTDHGPSP